MESEIIIVNDTEYPVEKNVPTLKSGENCKYPFASMKVGDSFSLGEFYPVRQRSVSAYAKWYAKRYMHGAKFAIRHMKHNQLRIWRIK